MLNLKFKLAAVAFMAILLCQSCCLIYGVGLQRAFADAAPDTYTMSNIIYINATGLGRSDSEIKRIVITETFKEPDVSGKDTFKGIGSNITTPVTGVDIDQFQNFYQDMGVSSVNILGHEVNCTGAQYAMGFGFNDELVPINTTDWYALGAGHPATTFPVLKRTLLFRSPAAYVEEFCQQNGYVLREILNSTYYQEYNMDTLNAFSSHLVKTDLALIQYDDPIFNESLSKLAPLQQYGAPLKFVCGPICSEIVTAILIGVILVFVLVTFALPVINNLLDNIALRNALKDSYKASYNALALGINTTANLADHMLADKNAQRQLAMNFFANGTISWEQLQYLLQQIDNSYNGLINNCTLNIAAMIAGYFNTTLGLYGKFAAAAAAESSWTDWIMDVIYLIAALMVAYVVYAFVSKSKGASQSGPAIYVTRV